MRDFTSSAVEADLVYICAGRDGGQEVETVAICSADLTWTPAASEVNCAILPSGRLHTHALSL